MSDGINTTIERMARREARAHLLVASAAGNVPGADVPDALALAIVRVPCPACGATGSSPPPPGVIAFDTWYPADDVSPAAGTLTMLACEWIPPRSYLPIALALERHGYPRHGQFRTRAAAWSAGNPAWTTGGRLTDIDATERWCDELQDGALFDWPRGPLTLPASTRLIGRLPPHFITPHGQRLPSELNQRYLEHRRTTVEALFETMTSCTAPALRRGQGQT